RSKRVLRHILSTCLYILLFATYIYAGELQIKPKNISDSQDASSLYFTTVSNGETYKLAEQYLEVIYKSTRPVWQIDIYTNNKTAETGSQKGGLLNTTTTTARLPLGWKVFSDKQTSPPTAGNPSEASSGWYWLKDKNDKDMPETDNNDESWTKAQKDGYTRIIYGGIYEGENYSCLPDGTLCSSPVYVYIEGIFDSVPSGDYSSTIWFDLCYIPDTMCPEISHQPIEKIGLIGNKIVIAATVTDNFQVESAKFHYKINNSSWQIKEMNLQGTQYNKTASVIFLPEEITSECTMYYAIEASDGYNTKWWKSKDSPQKMNITRTTVFSKVIEGEFSVPDGNPEDGSVSLSIPEKAITTPIDITVTLRNTDDTNIPDGNRAAGSKRPVAVYDFGPEGFVFKKPITMSLLYFDLDSDGKVDGTDIDEKELGVFWWDGFCWRYVGGKVDTEKNVVTAKITHFSLYGVFPVKPLSADDYRPKENIITPACVDTFNDFATFDGLFDEFEINIYDITGRKVITINQDSPSGPKWDGKDEFGNIVESGIYIYQFRAKADGRLKLISGTIAVAK
ncbi:MAG: gliding motility-associated C-terminal domain-containing protein, partial [Elusimicrobiota bacterium]|nr:gliding motility-associated C-terminal domain-containing protein [Elusimicrobiota bacterium]